MMLPSRRCLIVDDSPTFCAAVRDMLESAGMLVVATVSTLDAAVEAATVHGPDVVLVDIDLGAENGFDVVEALHGIDAPEPPAVILVSTHDQDDFTEMVEASSAIGFLQKFDLSAERVADMVVSSSRRGT
jgi:DNA-binding NarL/FixJ family response regulator